MKRLLITLIGVVTLAGMFTGYTMFSKAPQQAQEQPQESPDMKEILSELSPLDPIASEVFAIAETNLTKLGNILEKGQQVGADFRNETLTAIEEAKEKFNELKEIGTRFQNSQDQKVKELAKTCVKIQEYAVEVFNQDYSFVSDPMKYIKSKKNIETLNKYTNLLKAEVNHFNDLFQSAALFECLKDQEIETEKAS